MGDQFTADGNPIYPLPQQQAPALNDHTNEFFRGVLPGGPLILKVAGDESERIMLRQGVADGHNYVLSEADTLKTAVQLTEPGIRVLRQEILLEQQAIARFTQDRQRRIDALNSTIKTWETAKNLAVECVLIKNATTPDGTSSLLA